MKIIFTSIFTLALLPLMAQNDSLYRAQIEANKALARQFYEDLWGSNNTDKYTDYMADTYVAHDIGDRKGVTEPAIEQKIIADRFWENGEMEFELDYQIAEGDLVATRWIWHYKPESLFGKIFFGSKPIPIINVFRIREGKIVELWNHRHDIDTPMTMKYTFQGLLIGLAIGLVPLIWAIRLRRRLKRA